MLEQAPAEYYIDESGNTGDLSTVKIDSYFVEQRMFALAAFGCTLDQDFTDKLGALKKGAPHPVVGAQIKTGL